MSYQDSSDDEDYHHPADYSATGHHTDEKRYPIHDACEFESIEVLKKLICEPVEDDEDGVENGDHHEEDDDHDSSSDENDSTAAAHAAATGHSPPTISRGVTARTEGADPAPINLNDDTKPAADGLAHKSSGGDNSENAQSASSHLHANDDKRRASLCETTKIIVPTNPINEEARTPRVSNAKEMTEELKVAVGSGEEIIAATANGPQKEKNYLKPESMDVDDNTPALEEANAGNHEDLVDVGEKIPGLVDKSHHKKEIRYRLPPGTLINEKDEDENTALHVSIHSRKLEHVKLLLEMGASFRLKCDGSFAIHTAISMGSMRQHQQFAFECVVALHDAGADLTLKDDSNHTPLFLACMFNLPQIVSYILSDDQGLSTLNMRADRAGNRPLHAAAKFDTLTNPSLSKETRSSGSHLITRHHADGSVVSPKRIPGFPGKVASNAPARVLAEAATAALLTQELLAGPGIEVNAINGLGQTPLHVACSRGNWPVVRLLLQSDADPHIADRRGFTPGQVAYKRGMKIPVDLHQTLGDPPESGIIPPLRDLIVDPDSSTAILTHELCIRHRTCAPIRRDSPEPPPENVRRLHVLIDRETGILKSGEFGACVWKHEARRASVTDILKCHEYSYVESISQMASTIPDHPNGIAHLDPDTTVSRWSFEAAMRAAGSVCQAVDLVLSGDYRNAFCAIRPPGHHAGPRGIVRCANDPEGGSHGFCLFNNVAIGAAYARSMYRNDGIRKIAIVDFDVHHGNGTEEIIRQLVPMVEKVAVRTPFTSGELTHTSYRPWLDETDIQNVFFASTHGYGNRGFEQAGWFYPASGKSFMSDSITHPAMVENPSVSDFLSGQTWARMGDDARGHFCKIINVGMELPELSSDPQGRSMKQRLDLRDVYRTKILPHLREFDPDLIFVSAGFDAHRKDTMNFGYVGMVEDDYEWVTEQLVKVANTCCNGRIISVLEGGYKIHGGIVSPFARSVASHVRALVDGGRSRELFDPKDMEWEGQYERHIYEKRERKKDEDREKLRIRMEAAAAVHRTSNMLEQMAPLEDDTPPEDPDAPSRKRRRNQVDYKELYKQMQQEGFGSG